VITSTSRSALYTSISFSGSRHYHAEEIASVVEDQQRAAGIAAQFLEYLETLVGLVDPKNCEDPRNVRWNCERLLYSGLVRVRQLYDRQLEAPVVEKQEVAQVLAQRGQRCPIMRKLRHWINPRNPGPARYAPGHFGGTRSVSR